MGLFSRKKPVKKEDIRRGVIVVYKATDGWRWRFWSANGKCVADSGEAYNRKYDCKSAALRLREIAPIARLEVADGK